jgi:hypothetical protein
MRNVLDSFKQIKLMGKTSSQAATQTAEMFKIAYDTIVAKMRSWVSSIPIERKGKKKEAKRALNAWMYEQDASSLGWGTTAEMSVEEKSRLAAAAGNPEESLALRIQRATDAAQRTSDALGYGNYAKGGFLTGGGGGINTIDLIKTHEIMENARNSIAGVSSLQEKLHALTGGLIGKTSINSSLNYANGGWIREPVVGIGKNTGNTYNIAERGAEYVSSGKGGSGSTININIARIERDADFTKLKPMIQRWILESNSRRGMI